MREYELKTKFLLPLIEFWSFSNSLKSLSKEEADFLTALTKDVKRGDMYDII